MNSPMPASWQNLASLLLLLALGSRQAMSDEDAVHQAYRARMAGKIDEARQRLEPALGEGPGQALAWFELARLRFQQDGQSLDSAAAAIQRAVQLAPDESRYHRWSARIALYNGILKSHQRGDVQGEFRRAVAAAERAVVLAPDDHEARRMLVSLYGNNPPELGGNRDKAEQHVVALERRSPIDGAAARCEFALAAQPDKKVLLWREVAEKLPTEALAQEHLAIQYAWTGNIDEAARHAERALALNPQRAHVWLELSRALALQKQWEPAEKFARAYLEAAPPPPLALRA
ncbi:MAG: tetratricopeptide repeat protein, partial [Pirellulaceae bacterium]